MNETILFSGVAGVPFVLATVPIFALDNIATLVIVGGFAWFLGGGQPRGRRAFATAQTAIVLLVTGFGFFSAPAARADFKVHPPIVEYQEFEVEHNGSFTFDSNPGNNHNETGTLEFGYGVLPWWGTELEFAWSRMDGEARHLDEVNSENTFQLAEQGQYWLDPGIFFEIGKSTRRGNANHAEIGPTLQKEWGPTLHVVNLFFERTFGPDQDTHGATFNYAWQSRWRLCEWFEPGVEVFGEPGELAHIPSLSEQQHRAGPVVFGRVSLGSGLGGIKYQVGYLFGLTHATEKGALKWGFEWERPF